MKGFTAKGAKSAKGDGRKIFGQEDGEEGKE